MKGVERIGDVVSRQIDQSNTKRYQKSSGRNLGLKKAILPAMAAIAAVAAFSILGLATAGVIVGGVAIGGAIALAQAILGTSSKSSKSKQKKQVEQAKADAKAAKKAKAKAKAEAKAENWAIYEDDDGQTYYYNTVTAKTQGEKPEALEQAEADAKAASGRIDKSKDGKKTKKSKGKSEDGKKTKKSKKPTQAKAAKKAKAKAEAQASKTPLLRESEAELQTFESGLGALMGDWGTFKRKVRALEETDEKGLKNQIHGLLTMLSNRTQYKAEMFLFLKTLYGDETATSIVEDERINGILNS